MQEVRNTRQGKQDAYDQRMPSSQLPPMDETLTTADLNEATTRYDAAFRDVQGLIWLPWAGQHFPQRPPRRRLLVVGESHYVRPQTPEQLETSRQQHLEAPQYTRNVVSECLVNAAWPTKTLDRLPKLPFKTTEIDRPRLWADTAFYNLVQRPMHYNQEGQPEGPSWDDFVAGWRVFADVVRVIQPSHCLFIGVEAANSFNHTMTSLALSFVNVAWTEQVGRTYARTAKLEIAGKTTELFFVQHLGKFFRGCHALCWEMELSMRVMKASQ